MKKKINLHFHGLFFRLTGTREIGVSTNTANIGELLDELASKYGLQFRNLLFKGDILSDRIVVFLNGQNILHLGGEKAVLKDGDKVHIMSQVAGG